ncbi:MAG TPA: flavin reductase family protein [Sphingomicrobium sp.]|nr:flavin reductase family protein [Sphingomicrobium sp.]
MTELMQDFRAAMRRMAATVSLVTVCADDRPMGIAATAVTSVAMDPPSILVCVNRSASVHEHLKEKGAFCLNILHHDQLELARIFADEAQREARFGSASWVRALGSPPFLPDAQAVLTCICDARTAYGTHTIVLGSVQHVRLRSDIDPLLYLDGRFARTA